VGFEGINSIRKDLASKYRTEMTEQEVEEFNNDELLNGPMSLLTMAVKNHTQILISCRNNKKLLARVKAFDRHCNMVLENVKEVSSGFLWL
jgi:small nuclear ribonucleoprotein D2